MTAREVQNFLTNPVTQQIPYFTLTIQEDISENLTGCKDYINQSRRISEVSSLGGGKLRKPCVRGGGCGQVRDGRVYLWLEPKASSSGNLLAKPVACHPSPGHPPPSVMPSTRAVDPHSFLADPDPGGKMNADPDPAPQIL